MEQKAGITNKNLKVQYPLPERIGNPDLLTGKKKAIFLVRWDDYWGGCMVFHIIT
jgi:hypothetical protein